MCKRKVHERKTFKDLNGVALSTYTVSLARKKKTLLDFTTVLFFVTTEIDRKGGERNTMYYLASSMMALSDGMERRKDNINGKKNKYT